MKNKITMKHGIIAMAALALTAAACNKDKNETATSSDITTLKTEVLKDFTNNVAVATYKDLDDASLALYNAIVALDQNANEANLATARNAWKSMRTIWEQSESFLFGPVEDNEYDPNMDTWPTDYVQMDSLMASSNPLELADIKSATLSLRGFHPIEYIIFGESGNRVASTITARQKKYMVSLATDLKNTCQELHTSWIAAPTNFANEVINAGNGSAKYAKKQEVYLAIADGMVGICEEVGEGKMKEPYDAQDPKIVESPYSGNSTTDFKNNIVGIQNVYLGKYKIDGKGINEIVAAKNKALDNKIQAEITAAINSYDNITMPFGQAIISQRTQVDQTMKALATLKTTLDEELKPFIIQYIQD